MSVAYFYTHKDIAKQWRWRFVATNGKTIAVSSKAHHNLADCENSVNLVKKEGPTCPVIGDVDFKRARP